MPDKLQSVWRFEETPKSAQWRKTLQVWYMPDKLPSIWRFEGTPKNPQWRKAMHMWYLSEKFQFIWNFEEAPKNPQWRKNIQKWFMPRMLQSVRNYQGHLKVHSSEKPYKCDLYQARLSESGTCESGRDTKESPVIKAVQVWYMLGKLQLGWNLKKRLRSHSGEKPYKCDICIYYHCKNSDTLC